MVQQAVRSGCPIPERVLQAPTLQRGLQLYLQAFFDLDAERSRGMSVGRIPWSAIVRYAEHLDLDEDQTDSLIYFLGAMDAEHLKRLNKE